MTPQLRMLLVGAGFIGTFLATGATTLAQYIINKMGNNNQ